MLQTSPVLKAKATLSASAVGDLQHLDAGAHPLRHGVTRLAATAAGGGATPTGVPRTFVATDTFVPTGTVLLRGGGFQYVTGYVPRWGGTVPVGIVAAEAGVAGSADAGVTTATAAASKQLCGQGTLVVEIRMPDGLRTRCRWLR